MQITPKAVLPPLRFHLRKTEAVQMEADPNAEHFADQRKQQPGAEAVERDVQRSHKKAGNKADRPNQQIEGDHSE